MKHIKTKKPFVGFSKIIIAITPFSLLSLAVSAFAGDVYPGIPGVGVIDTLNHFSDAAKDKALSITGTADYIAEGASYTATGDYSSALYAASSGNITLTDVTLSATGMGQSYPYAAGFYKKGAGNVTISGGKFVTGDVNYLGGYDSEGIDTGIGYSLAAILLDVTTGTHKIGDKLSHLTEIETYGRSAIGINLSSSTGAATIENVEVRTWGSEAHGISKTGTSNITLKSATIVIGDANNINDWDGITGLGYMTHGVYLSGSGMHLIGSAEGATKITTYGRSAFGVYLSNGSATIENVDTHIFGQQSYGIYKTGTGDVLFKNGTIVTGDADYKNDILSSGSFGIYVYLATGTNIIGSSEGTAKITTYGRFGTGINVFSSSAAIENVSIQTFGQQGYGIYKRSAGDIMIKSATIVTGSVDNKNDFSGNTGLGYGAHGIYLNVSTGANVIGSTDGTVAITTYGRQAFGIFVKDSIVAMENVNIHTWGQESHGILVSGTKALSFSDSASRITTEGSGAHGLVLVSKNQVLTSASSLPAIEVKGERSAVLAGSMTLDGVQMQNGANHANTIGVLVSNFSETGEGSAAGSVRFKGDNTVTMNANGAWGVAFRGANSLAFDTGSRLTIVTNGNAAHGLVAWNGGSQAFTSIDDMLRFDVQGSGSALLAVIGDIRESALVLQSSLENGASNQDGTIGMLAQGNYASAVVSENGSISMTGVGAHAMAVRDGGSIEVTNGSLSATGSGASAIYATGGTSRDRNQITLNNATIKSNGTAIVADGGYSQVTIKGNVTVNPLAGGRLRAGPSDSLFVAKNGANAIFTVDGVASTAGIEARDTSILDVNLINGSIYSGNMVNARNVDVDSHSVWNVTADTSINGALNVSGRLDIGKGIATRELSVGGIVTLNSGSLLRFTINELDGSRLIGSGTVLDLTGVTFEFDYIGLTGGAMEFYLLASDFTSISGHSEDSYAIDGHNYLLEADGGTLKLVQFSPVPEPSSYAIIFGVATLAAVATRRRRKIA